VSHSSREATTTMEKPPQFEEDEESFDFSLME
jgi:hypothetical protein